MVTDEPRLRADSVVLAPNRPPVSEVVRPGEIVGLAGLEGHGQELFLHTLAGLHRAVSGTVTALSSRGREAAVRSFRQAVRMGIAYLPRDRGTKGIFPVLSVLDNFSIASLERDRRWGLLSQRRRLERFEIYRNQLAIVLPSAGARMTMLSGGNQQKVLLARWLALNPRVLLLNDPTRGVDLGTRRVLYNVFRELATKQGVPLVLLSTEIDELVQLCHRVLVFREDTVFARIEQDTLTTDSVIAAMFGHAHGAGAA